MRWLIILSTLLLCSIAWWFGMPVGLATSFLVAGGLILVRHAVQRSGSTSALALMPIWQLVLAAVLSLPIGVGLGGIAFVLGPGFWTMFAGSRVRAPSQRRSRDWRQWRWLSWPSIHPCSSSPRGLDRSVRRRHRHRAVYWPTDSRNNCKKHAASVLTLV